MLQLTVSVTEGISLITSSECSDNGVSEAESKSFIESQVPVAAAAVEDVPDEVDDADDLVSNWLTKHSNRTVEQTTYLA